MLDNDQPEIIGQLYPDGVQSGTGFDIVSAAHHKAGFLIADTVDDRRIVCSPESRWVFISASGKKNEVSF